MKSTRKFSRWAALLVVAVAALAVIPACNKEKTPDQAAEEMAKPEEKMGEMAKPAGEMGGEMAKPEEKTGGEMAKPTGEMGEAK